MMCLVSKEKYELPLLKNENYFLMTSGHKNDVISHYNLELISLISSDYTVRNAH